MVVVVMIVMIDDGYDGLIWKKDEKNLVQFELLV